RAQAQARANLLRRHVGDVFAHRADDVRALEQAKPLLVRRAVLQVRVLEDLPERPGGAGLSDDIGREGIHLRERPVLVGVTPATEDAREEPGLLRLLALGLGHGASVSWPLCGRA